MLTEHLACDVFINSSEERAFNAVETCLRKLRGARKAYVLTNLANSIGNTGQPDEIDMIVVSANGVAVVEVKHWDRDKIARSQWDVEDAADLITKKTKRLVSKVRGIARTSAYISSAMIFTKETGSFTKHGKLEMARGVRIASVTDLELLLASNDDASLTDQEIERVARTLAPRAVAARNGDIKRIGRITDLKRLTPEHERFSRVYSGRDASSADRVTVHLFDLSATNAANAERLARREFEVVQKLQKSPYLPKLVDSFQAVPNYPGELFYFTLADTSAPSVASVSADGNWARTHGTAFCESTFRGLAELHAPSDADTPTVVHRGINPDTIRVRHDNSPLFSGWRWARVQDAQTIITPGDNGAGLDDFAAPEVAKSGLSIADTRSDVFSLCRTFLHVFVARQDNVLLRGILTSCAVDDPKERPDAKSVSEKIAQLVPMGIPAPAPEISEEPQRWDEDALIKWEGGTYRVVSKLGVGAVGRTYKLEQVDKSGTSLGTFVGKVVVDPAIGTVSLNAYQKIRAIADHASLSGVFHCTAEWSSHRLMALLKWRKGEPLGNWSGELLHLLAEDVFGHAQNAEPLVFKWLSDLCSGLEVLHAQNWVHGDVSPSNIIVEGSSACLIDFDLAGEVGQIPHGSGTLPYVSKMRRNREPARASDDVFSLAASMFSALVGRSPFVFEDGVRRDDAGLAWREGERASYPVMAAFLDRATAPDLAHRFGDAGTALAFLRQTQQHSETTKRTHSASFPPAPLRPNVVPRAKELLSIYPGSRYGNSESRGLDSDFASDTFVKTGLDETLLEGIRSGNLSLVILCGNAGDGKTALLQHLSMEMGQPQLKSDKRTAAFEAWGRSIVVNFDGAASWGGRSADTLMDEIFAPFHDGAPDRNIVHLVAVNNGRLMEWSEYYEARNGASRLTSQIIEVLSTADSNLDGHVLLVELNDRSLVGGIDGVHGRISTRFVDEMISRLTGGSRAAEIWHQCRTCSAMARCSIRASAEMMGASADPIILADGALLRSRLVEALQAVHQRDEVHITARELKAALSYILFGINACEDIHADPSVRPHDPSDFAFNPKSPLRQGDLLRELARLDPALEAHSRIDRYLTAPGLPSSSHGASRYPDLPLREARRRAYFQWTDFQIAAVGGAKGSLGLAQGRHFSAFRMFPFLTTLEQDELRDELCRGLSRLEALPEAAFKARDVAPIRIVPRTPTETAFWVGKPLDRFKLEAERFSAKTGLEVLHRHLVLAYRTADERTERLRISLPLFALLRDLNEGAQLIDAFSDDVFANLNVFTQRLAQEDEQSVLAWTPANDTAIYSVNIIDGNDGQVISLREAE